jgi:uncharacterized protein YcfL
MKALFLVAVLLVLVALLLGSGCATSRDARTASAERISATHASTIDKSLEAEQIPIVTQSGNSNSITIVPAEVLRTIRVNDAVDTEGAASNSARSSFKMSFSTWLAIGFATLAGAALLVAWVVFSKFSALGQATDRGFGVIGDQISTLAATVTTDEAANALAQLRASVEKQRGKLTSRSL